MTADIHTRMKHAGSFLPDLEIRCSFDDEKKCATAVVDHFDSVLALMFFRRLAQDGMLCIEDESDPSANRPSPPWAVFLIFAGIRYRCRVVLRPRNETAVSLTPEPSKTEGI